MLRMARHINHETGEKNLCLAGGVALNCVGSGRILRAGPFEPIWIQPAAGDAGGALVAPVKKEIRREMSSEEQKRFGLDKLHVARSSIPAHNTSSIEKALFDRITGYKCSLSKISITPCRRLYGRQRIDRKNDTQDLVIMFLYAAVVLRRDGNG